MPSAPLNAFAFAALLGCVPLVQAQSSSVSMYGLLDGSVGVSRAVGSSARLSTLDSGKMSTSYLGFSGREDLGSGLSAMFTLDSFLRADSGQTGRFNGDAMWARNAFVGLASQQLGSLRIGRNTTPLFVATLQFNAFGDSFGYSPSIRHYFSSGTATGDSGWSDSVLYASPKVGGFDGGVIVAAGEGAGSRNWGAQMGYRGPALAAALVFQRVGKDGSAALPLDNTDTWQLGSSYDLGTVKLFAQLGKVDNRSKRLSYRLNAVGAAITLGGGKLLAQYGQIDPSAGARRNTVSLGYDHWLSKRTDLYAVLMSDKVAGMSSGYSQSVGIRHRF